MGKIFDYASIGIPAGDDPLFIADYSTDNSNPEIKYVTTDNLFKRTNIWAADGNGLSLKDDGGNLSIFIDDGANIGIGTTDVESWDSNYLALEWGGSAIVAHDTDNAMYFVGNGYYDGSWKYKKTNATSQLSFVNGELSYKSASGASADSVISYNTRFKIDLDGNMLVNDDGSPSAPFHVVGPDGDGSTPALNSDKIALFENSASASDNAFIYIISGASGNSVLNFGDTDSGVSGQIDYDHANNSLSFATNGSPNRMVIDSSGQVGIGDSTPDEFFHLKKNTSGTIALIENSSSTSAILQLKNSAGNSTYVVNGPSNLVLGPSTTAGSDTVNIARGNGNLHVGGTDTNFKLQVTSSSYQGVRINTNASAGGAVAILSDETNPADLLLTFSRTVSSTANVNWMVGNFYDSASYFGIHWKNATLNDTNAKFDGTLANNLFYINTSGDQYLAKSINTHNLTNTGHNTGRFVHSYTIRAYLSGSTQVIMGAFGNGFSSTALAPDIDSSDYQTQVYTPAPFDGKLINAQFYGSDTTGGAYGRNLLAFFSKTTPGGSAPPVTLDTGNSSYLNSVIAVDDLDVTTVVTKGDSDFNETGGSLSFSQNDLLAFAVEPSGGGDNGYVSITLTYEFKIT